jgi:hypothetical protein
MTEPVQRARAAVIAQRLQILEMEAAVQRTTLAATFAEWEERRTMTWLIGAAKVAGGVLAGPTAKWLLSALLMRIIRGRFL